MIYVYYHFDPDKDDNFRFSFYTPIKTGTTPVHHHL